MFIRSGFLPSAYISMLLVIFILPFHSVAEYSILRNTTSQLGAQGAPNAWMMSVEFALLGLASIVDGWVRLSKYWIHKVLIVAFGISMVLTGIFQHAPVNSSTTSSLFEDNLHSVFSTIGGFSFILFAIAAAFIESSKLRKTIAVGIGLLAMLLSMLIFNLPDLAGVWQRLMFIVMFAWLMYFLFSRSSHQFSNIREL